jgi:hypothetical protein
MLSLEMRFLFSKIYICGLILWFGSSLHPLLSFSGSLEVGINQRFFDDDRFGNVNGFSEWWAPHLDLSIGVVELGWGLEPIIGFGYIKNESTACAVDTDGFTCLTGPGGNIASEDRFRYQIYSFSGGLQWKAWEPDYFVVVPLTKVLINSRYSRIRKQTSNISERKLVTGVDWGAELYFGALFSFFYDKAKRRDLTDEWDVKDTGLTAQVRYLPAGWFKQGLGTLTGTGGWSFGVGLFVDW